MQKTDLRPKESRKIADSCGGVKLTLMTKPSHPIEKLSKFLSYILGRRPDEFGIVPDADGYVRIKELLQALHEDQDWRHVRQAHLNEALIVPEKPVIEIEGPKIRAIEKSLLPVPGQPGDLPKLLYMAIRPRAYPGAMDRGFPAKPGRHLILAADSDMALRMGRRLDSNPTLLAVQVSDAIKNGTTFQRYGQALFLADMICPGTFSGPPLPKTKSDATVSNVSMNPPQAKTPGSYFPQLDSPLGTKPITPSTNRRKEPQWKKDRRQARRYKANLRKPNDA
jgi:putative RNA 2'-phosphotransferase